MASSSSSSLSRVVVKSSDNNLFVVNKKVASQSQLLKQCIDNMEEKGTNDVILIPLSNVTSNILTLVLEYCEKHADFADDDNNNQELKQWDHEFLKKFDYATLNSLTMAADYMVTKSLLNLCCQFIADSIKDLTVQQIRQIFDIKNDFTPQEEADIKNENAWAFR
ncbi:SKP1-like protein 14 [Bienertia sinuspersici]